MAPVEGNSTILDSGISGDPNTQCPPATSWSIFVFFATNYLAHCTTVKMYPGSSGLDVAVATALALFLPSAGITRALFSISRCARFRRDRNPLERAAAAGALRMVVRNEDWTPGPGDLIEPELDSQGKIRIGAGGTLPDKLAGAHEDSDQVESDDAGAVQSDHTGEEVPLAPMADRHEGVDSDAPVIEGIFLANIPGELDLASDYDAPVSLINHTQRDQHRFHGKALLPKGYSWAAVPDQAKIRWAEHDREAEPGRLIGGPHDLSSNYNWIQSLIALFQVGSAGLTLYKARGTQIQRYGYAAFGLTVVPYLVMSILNLVAQIATADYPNVFMVGSPLLEEARRHGGVFDGVVGHLEPQPRDDDDGAKPVYEVRADENGGLVLDKVSGSDAFPRTLGLRNGEKGGADAESKGMRVAGYPSFDLHSRPTRRGFGWLAAHYFILPMILGCLSLIVVGALSRFDAGESSSAQRGWTMTWLAAGIGCGWWADWLAGVFIPDRDKDTGKVEATDYLAVAVVGIVCCGFLCIPAIGGFVVVGEMLRDYGVCNS